MAIDYPAQLAWLKELQEIDLKLHRDRVSLDALPRERAVIEEAHRSARAEFDALKSELKEIEKRKRTDEMELAASEEHYKDREKRLYAIKTNKEYQAAVKEISDAKRANREREDRILQAMEKIESLTQKITQLESEIADKDKEFEKQLDELAAREAQVKEEMSAFESRRPALTGQIDVSVMRRYDFVRRRFPEALVPIRRGVCSGCSMNIPPQFNIEVIRAKDFHTCPSCHRLIYVPGEDETKQDKAG